MKQNLLHRFLHVCFLLIVISAGLHAQQTYSCVQPGAPTPPGNINCAASCIYCTLDGVVDVNNQTLPTPQSNFCMNLENPRWYGFIAGSANIAIKITPTTSATGNGIEAMVTSGCTTVIDCTPGFPGNGTLPVTLFLNGLTVGAAYQLCVDGFMGDVCNYKISVPAGSTIPPPLGAIGAIQGPSQVCPNGTITFSIPPVDNAIAYLWTAPAGASINGGTNSLSVPAPGGTSVEIKFGTQGGTVCVSASNPCSAPVSICKTVVNKALSIVDLAPEVVCYQNLPYIWPEQPNNVIGSPGTYTLTSTPYASYWGCDSIVRQKITILPIKIVNLAPIFLCPGTCFSINGNDYCDSGSYSETLTSFNGCDSLVNFNVHIIPVHAVIQPTDTITCFVPTLPLTSVGSTTGNTVSYNWTNGAWQSISTTNSATATSADTLYHLIVSNFQGGVGCHDTATIIVPQRIRKPNAFAGPPRVLGCDQTELTIHGNGSHGPQYTYLWVASNGGNILSGSTTLMPVVNAAGTYQLHVTNTHTGCTNVSMTHVTVSTIAPTIGTVTAGVLTCRDTSVLLQATTTPNQVGYTWTGPNNFLSHKRRPRVNTPGVYTVVVVNIQDACTASATVTVTSDYTPPGATIEGGDLTCVADSVILNGHSPATGAVKFEWSGSTGFLDSIPSITVKTAGDYNLIVTGLTNGCTSTATTTVALNTTLPGAAIDASGNLNCNNSTINLISTSTAAPGNLNHIWTNPNNSKDTTGTGTLLAVGQPGTYNLLIVNSINGCTSTATISVIKHDPVTASIANASNVNCFGDGSGQLTAGANGGDSNYTYQWSNSVNTASDANVGPGTYTVTITDGENCTSTASGVVTQPAQLLANATATAQSAAGASDGTASANPAGGTPGYTYSWSNGATTAALTGLNPGLYTVTVLDGHGCTAEQTISVNAYNCAIQSSVIVQNVGCYGETNGSASISLNGGTPPFTYNWSNGLQTASSNSLGSGFYGVTITDASNCLVAVSFTVLQADTLLANVNPTPSSGPTSNNGVATASPTGGSGTYTYHWNTGATTSSINNLAGGTYTVTVTDSKNCTAVQSTVITVGHCGVVNGFLVTNAACFGTGSGSATVTLTGGFPPFSYKWSSGGTGSVESGLHAGTYEVSITDVKGCQIVDTTHITEPTLLTAMVTSTTNTVCKNTPEGAITLTSAGGTGTASVLWSSGQTQFSISGLLSGSYTATVTDQNGCTVTTTAVLQAIDLVAPTIQVGALDTVSLGASGTITLTAQNVKAIVADNCEVASVKITPDKFTCSDLGTHVVTMVVTDDSGNTASQSFTVKIVDDAPPTLSCPSSTVRCFGDDNVQYNAPTALDNCLALGGSFAQTAGLPSGSVYPPGTTINTYSFTDSQGNVGTCSFDVTILTELKVKIDTVINDINNQHIGGIHLTVTGSLSPYQFTWTENGNPVTDSTGVLTGIGQGDYQVSIKDANGCTVETAVIHVSSVTATNNPDWISEVAVYPNPTTGNLTVVMPDELVGKPVLLSAYDQTGRKVFEQTSTQEKQLKLDLSKLATGMYYLRIQMDESQVIKKIVVDR
jgi:hypothetical protein